MHGRGKSSRPCETALLTGVAPDDVEAAQRAAASLRTLVRRAAAVTLREPNAVFASDDESGHVPAFATEGHDTTGAGDAFYAPLTFALASGRHLRNAVMLGDAAGSLAVRALGKTSSLPNGDAVTKLAGW